MPQLPAMEVLGFLNHAVGALHLFRGDSMGIHLGRVGHIGIHVSDVDRSVGFYRQVLGLKVTGRWVPPTSGAPFVSCASRTNTTMWCCSSYRRT
jgi:catechol-2,3-dioxygenase